MNSSPTLWQSFIDFFFGGDTSSSNGYLFLPLVAIFVVGLIVSIRKKGNVSARRRIRSTVGCSIGIVAISGFLLFPYLVNPIMNFEDGGNGMEAYEILELINMALLSTSVLFIVLAAVCDDKITKD